jgi:4-alpha-glucanotransferase
LSNQEFKEKKIAEIMSRVEYQVQNNVMKFIATHDVDLVRQYFTNTVLTPTETAQILAKANLDAHSA